MLDQSEMLKITSLILVATSTLLMGACGGSQEKASAETQPSTEASDPTAAEPQAAEQGSVCPFMAPEVDVSVEDTATGVAITATGGEDDVAFLRRWGARMAAKDNRRGGGGMHGKGMHQSSGGMMGMMPPSEARAEDVPGGVRLNFEAKEPEDVAELRQRVRQHAEMMGKDGSCPMMQDAG